MTAGELRLNHRTSIIDHRSAAVAAVPIVAGPDQNNKLPTVSHLPARLLKSTGHALPLASSPAPGVARYLSCCTATKGSRSGARRPQSGPGCRTKIEEVLTAKDQRYAKEKLWKKHAKTHARITGNPARGGRSPIVTASVAGRYCRPNRPLDFANGPSPSRRPARRLRNRKS
jgi:hypothetical protein